MKEQRIVAIDAGGALCSKTANPSVFALSVYGLSRHINVADVVPMRRTAMNGTAGDDGYVVVGHSVLGSLVARYLAGPRAADDPTEREGDHADAHYNLGLLYDELGQRAQAMSHLMQARRLYSQSQRQ